MAAGWDAGGVPRGEYASGAALQQGVRVGRRCSTRRAMGGGGGYSPVWHVQVSAGETRGREGACRPPELVQGGVKCVLACRVCSVLRLALSS